MSGTENPVWERTPDARYYRDGKFRMLVDMLEAHLHQTDFTPTEMREGAMLAAIHYEHRNMRRVAGYTMSVMTAQETWMKIEDIYAAIQKDERPLEPQTEG